MKNNFEWPFRIIRLGNHFNTNTIRGDDSVNIERQKKLQQQIHQPGSYYTHPRKHDKRLDLLRVPRSIYFFNRYREQCTAVTGKLHAFFVSLLIFQKLLTV